MALIFSTYQQFRSLTSPSIVHCPKPHLRCSKSSMASTIPNTSKEPSSLNKPFGQLSHKQISQVTYSMPPEKVEIFKSLDGWVRENVLVHLKPVEKCWQPQHFLPNPTSDGFFEQVEELRERAREIPDDCLVVLVGDMITEEALPTYQAMFNTHDGVRDETGSSLTAWGVWIRVWTAEENRHGDLLNKYLYLSGKS